MQRPRMQQTMPEDRSGWHHIDAGPHLEILFHPDRRLAGREPDQVKRTSIVVAVAGKRDQALRFDGMPTAVKPAPLLGEHTAEVLADWLGLDDAAVAGLRQDGIV